MVLDTWLLIRYFDDDERAASAVQRLQRPDNGVMPLASAVTLGEVYKALVKTEGVRASDRPAVQTLAPSPTGTLPGQLVVSAAVDRSWPVYRYVLRLHVEAGAEEKAPTKGLRETAPIR